MADPVKLVCFEGDLENLLADLAVHKLDMVLSDRPIPTGLNVRAFNHRLGMSNLAFFGHPDLLAQTRKNARIKTFPEILDKAPVIMPLHTNALRRSLDDWFEQIGISPSIIAEFDDSALLKVFGQAGSGFFAAPSVISKQIQKMYGVEKVGDIEDVQENYYVISPERHLKHHAVIEITEAAKRKLNTDLS
jgi:LysR family transcriptional activator of nhaA